VPPLHSREKKDDRPAKGKFFEDGYADLFIRLARTLRAVGTISCGEDQSVPRAAGTSGNAASVF